MLIIARFFAHFTGKKGTKSKTFALVSFLFCNLSALLKVCVPAVLQKPTEFF
jgi:hypothetical protein